MLDLCFVGLANPGAKYDKTRHNIGKDWLISLGQSYGITFQSKQKYQAEIAYSHEEKIMWAIPENYVNNSGLTVEKIKKYIFNVCILFYAVSIYFLFNPLHTNPTISFIIFLFLTTFFFSILNINFYSLSVFFKGIFPSPIGGKEKGRNFKNQKNPAMFHP